MVNSIVPRSNVAVSNANFPVLPAINEDISSLPPVPEISKLPFTIPSYVAKSSVPFLTVTEEIAAASEFNEKKKTDTLYFGGGTPTTLSQTQLETVINKLKDAFDMSAVNEFTVEAGRPDTFTEEKLKITKDAGVNRICVNPQTFSDETLALIGRRHTAEQVIDAYHMAEKYGFDINIDLIAGLPGEDPGDFRNSLSLAVQLQPENITVHSLCLKSGSRLKERVSRIDGGEIDEMIALSREMLTSAGYEPYYLYRQKYQAGANENTGWCRPGKACAYNIGTMEEICSNIAVGAGAISKRVFGGGSRIERLASPKDIPSYLAKCAAIIRERLKLFE